jgi:hypothetical protein
MEASLRTGRIACGVGFVAAIMPEGVGSGKPRASAAIMPPCCRHCIFRKAEWSADRRRRA